MSNLTRRGVAKDLKTSPYTFTEIINGVKVVFYFSSKLHLDNFKKILQKTLMYAIIYLTVCK